MFSIQLKLKTIQQVWRYKFNLKFNFIMLERENLTIREDNYFNNDILLNVKKKKKFSYLK